jgi:hypothetical protein
MTDGISPRQFYEAEGVDDWRVLADAAGSEADIAITIGRG